MVETVEGESCVAASLSEGKLSKNNIFDVDCGRKMKFICEVSCCQLPLSSFYILFHPIKIKASSTPKPACGPNYACSKQVQFLK
jgi:hypothetical protein